MGVELSFAEAGNHLRFPQKHEKTYKVLETL